MPRGVALHSLTQTRAVTSDVHLLVSASPANHDVSHQHAVTSYYGLPGLGGASFPRPVALHAAVLHVWTLGNRGGGAGPP